MQSWTPTQPILDHMARKTGELIQNFPNYLARFDHISQTDKTFAGAGLYFHYACISKYAHLPIAEKFAAKGYLEYVYAVLASWGVQRSGKYASRLLSFAEFSRDLLARREALQALEGYSLWSLDPAGLRIVMAVFSGLLDEMAVALNQIPLITNSIVYHHVLPELVPPIERYFVLTYFGIDEDLLAQYTGSSIFAALLPYYIQVARERESDIRALIHLDGENWHTSVTKVIDNAIVGAPR